MHIDEVAPEAIEEALPSLSSRDMKLILSIYNSPGSMMTGLELKRETGMLPVAVGQVGKKLGSLCGVEDFGSYRDGKKIHVAYFQMIGDYREHGWAMNHNLRIAIKSYLEKKVGWRKKPRS